jgi:hypothetical protein
MTKYVSCSGTSSPIVARNNPVSPPIVNRPMNPTTKKVGDSHDTEPLYIVAVQLKVFTADGTATSMLMNENTRPA